MPVNDSSNFESAVVAACRVKQLLRGCTPRIAGNHKATTMARLEVAAGAVARIHDVVAPVAIVRPVPARTL